MKILFVASEAAPFAKTGGLGDVIGALPRALAARGHEILVVLPKYGSIDEKAFGQCMASDEPILGNGVAAKFSTLPVRKIEAPPFRQASSIGLTYSGRPCLGYCRSKWEMLLTLAPLSRKGSTS